MGSLLGARWVLKPADEGVAERLAQELGIGDLTARALVCRGVADPGAARAFLGRDLAALADPFTMADMRQAVDMVESALQRRARIRIYGDYDVDGVCATALLVRALRRLGAEVDWYIPHRVEEGYDVNEEAVRQAHRDGVELLITVDCGSTALGPVALAQSLGMQVVVTDHHRLGDRLPQAPVLNPCRADCSYPFGELAGVGVAFKLVSALARVRGIPTGQESNFLDLVCLGTVADVVPLLGENRLFVQHGLGRIASSRKAGIRALLAVAGIAGKRAVGTRDVAFGLAPRINAAGRMEDARAAVRLLLTQEVGEAQRLARELAEHNEARQLEEKQTLAQAEEMVAAQVDLTREKVVVLSSEQWHPGVIGIVAARLVERYHRPALLVAVSEGVGKGSGRSVAALNLWEALQSCACLLIRFGGHRYAAGFAVEAGKIDELRRQMNQFADGSLTQEDLLPCIEIDAEVSATQLTLEAVSELSQLAPFGRGNPRPTFMSRQLEAETASPVGDGSHLSLRLRRGRDDGIDAIWFGGGRAGEQLRAGQLVDVCYRPLLDDWRGTPRVRLQVVDVCVSDGR